MIKVLHTLPDFHVGGVANLMLNNILAMDDQRFENHVCVFGPRDDMRPHFEATNAHVHMVRHYGLSQMFSTLQRFRAFVRKLQPDIIHNHIPLDVFISTISTIGCDVSIVNTIHNINNPYSNTSLYKKLLRLAVDLSRRWKAQHIIAVSEAVREAYMEHHWVQERKTSVIYSGIDTDAWSEPDDPSSIRHLREELGLKDRYPVLLNVARLTRFKGQKYLIKMMPSLLEDFPQAKLLIAGDGSLRGELEEEIKQRGLGGHVQLLGQRDDVAVLLHASDIFVFPSESEGLGVALLEAMAAGKPVVATRMGPFLEVVEDGQNGILVKTGCAEPIASAVARIASDRDTLSKMGAASQHIARSRFDLQQSVNRLENVYQSLATVSPTTDTLSV